MNLNKSALLKYDPDDRAFMLVGAYLGYFALLESGINNAICDVLELKGARALIVTRNMAFSDKIKTLRSLVNFVVRNEEQAKTFSRLAHTAKEISETRNIIAHTPFHASNTSDGVTFFVIKATSNLSVDNLDWSIDDFLREIDHINDTDNRLREIEKRMSLQRIAEALMKSGSSVEKFGGLLGLGNKLMQDETDQEPPEP